MAIGRPATRRPECCAGWRMPGPVRPVLRETARQRAPLDGHRRKGSTLRIWIRGMPRLFLNCREEVPRPS